MRYQHFKLSFKKTRVCRKEKNEKTNHNLLLSHKSYI